jgi:hypothetical protein
MALGVAVRLGMTFFCDGDIYFKNDAFLLQQRYGCLGILCLTWTYSIHPVKRTALPAANVLLHTPLAEYPMAKAGDLSRVRTIRRARRSKSKYYWS